MWSRWSAMASAPSRCAGGRFRTPCFSTSRCRAWTGCRPPARSRSDPGTPVIILTAHGHPNLIDQAVEDGVISYLLKPATNPSLHAAIQVAVARAASSRSCRKTSTQLKSTLRERKLIERAKGILMSRKQLSESEAFRLLQRQSQDRRIPMAKLAESIIQTDELFEAPDQAGSRRLRGRLRRHLEMPTGNNV